jgi:hypothetical protein
MRSVAAPILVLVVALLPLGRPVLAAGRSREQREAEARQACAAGRVETGIEILAGLLTEYGHPNYIYNQARCYQQNGRAQPAISRFKEYLRAASDVTADERARVERFIGELEAEVQAAAPPPAKTEQPPPSLPAAPPPEPVVVAHPVPAPAPSSSGPFRPAAIVLGAVGIAGIATGAVSSLQVRSLNREVETLKVGQFDTRQLNAQGDKAHRYEILQWVGYGIGSAALAGAVVCLILDHQTAAPEHAGRVRLIGGLDRGGNPQLALAGGF